MKRVILFLSFMLTLSPLCFGDNWNIEDGIKLYKEQERTSAKLFFEDYTKIFPNDPLGFYYLGLIYKDENNLLKSKYNLEKSYNLTNDISDFQIAPDVQNLPIEDYLDMAKMFLEDNNLKSALEYADLTNEIDPNNKEAYLLKTEIYLKLKNKEASYQSFLHVLEQDSSYLNSDWAVMLEIKELPKFNDNYYNSKGLQYFYIGENNKAKENFNLALKINPKNYKALNNIGNIYLMENDIKTANNYFKKALSNNGSDTSIYRNLAKTNKKKEESYLKQAISINPNDKYVYYQLGKYYKDNGDLENAILNFKQATSLDKSFVEGYLELIKIYVENKNTNEAIINCRKALNSTPDNAEIYYYLALLSEDLSRNQEGIDYILTAIKNAKNPNYYKEASEIFFKLGDTNSANEILRTGLSIFPNSKILKEIEYQTP